MRVITAYGIPGYGPDASNESYGVSETWPEVADELRRMLEESADGLGDSAEQYAAGEDFREAWFTRKRADAMYNLAANLDNTRASAPLYADNPAAWAATIEATVAEHFPYDVDSGCRIYAWADDTFGADGDQD